MPLICCEIELDLPWSINCVVSEDDNNLSSATFKINNTKRYVDVATLSIDNNDKFLEHLKQGF